MRGGGASQVVQAVPRAAGEGAGKNHVCALQACADPPKAQNAGRARRRARFAGRVRHAAQHMACRLRCQARVDGVGVNVDWHA